MAADLEKVVFILKVLVEQFHRYQAILAKIHNLPDPTPLPENWDELLKEPSEPPADGDGQEG